LLIFKITEIIIGKNSMAITVPGDVKKGDNWSGTSTADGGGEHKNLDSEMNFIQHQRIVLAAGKLLANFDAVKSNVEWYKINKITGPEAAGALGSLKNCYERSDGNITLSIAKGIHQRKSDPHITLSVKVGGLKSKEFHLNLSAVKLSGDHARGLTEKDFQWVGVQFSYNSQFKWPEACARSFSNVTGIGNRRRHSISLTDQQAKNVQFDVAQAEQRAADEAERKAKEEAEAARHAAEKEAEHKAALEAARKKHNAQADTSGQERGKAWTAFCAKNKRLPHIGKPEQKNAANGQTVVLKDGRKLTYKNKEFFLK
jgi:hypothetical protein